MTATQEKIPGTEPILCAHLLRQVDAQLIELLSSLDPAEWDLPTVAGQWRVRDVAAHLLDTCLRKLSLVRDNCFVEQVDIRSPQDVVDLVNRLNREGVAVYRRLSPSVLVEMMQSACTASADFHESLDPFATAAFNVSWAGESTSLNWFDTARELTERWHHQQQIRLATNRPGIETPELYHPVLDCFVRGLPHSFRAVDAPSGTLLLLEISGGVAGDRSSSPGYKGDAGGQWAIERQATGWRFAAFADRTPDAHIVLPQSIAWRVFTKGIDRDAALAQSAIKGNRALAERVLQLTAIVA